MRESVRRFLARPQVVTVAATILALMVTFVLRPGAVHPQLSKQAVINAAVSGSKAGQFSRVEAKLLYRRDFQRAEPQWGTNQPNQLIWVVAVSGNFGMAPSFRCCSVPADYPGHNTWGIAVIVDKPGPPQMNEFEGSWHGDWPPFFDGLPDLAAT
jgi:hypothetical protein